MDIKSQEALYAECQEELKWQKFTVLVNNRVWFRPDYQESPCLGVEIGQSIKGNVWALIQDNDCRQCPAWVLRIQCVEDLRCLLNNIEGINRKLRYKVSLANKNKIVIPSEGDLVRETTSVGDREGTVLGVTSEDHLFVQWHLPEHQDYTPVYYENCTILRSLPRRSVCLLRQGLTGLLSGQPALHQTPFEYRAAYVHGDFALVRNICVEDETITGEYYLPVCISRQMAATLDNERIASNFIACKQFLVVLHEITADAPPTKEQWNSAIATTIEWLDNRSPSGDGWDY